MYTVKQIGLVAYLCACSLHAVESDRLCFSPILSWPRLFDVFVKAQLPL